MTSLDRLYSSDSTAYKKNEEALTDERVGELVEVFRTILSDLEKVFDLKGETFCELLFRNPEKSYNKDLVFMVLVSAIIQLRNEHYCIGDYEAFARKLENLADNELVEIITSAECKWNRDVRTRLIDRVKCVLKTVMEFKEFTPEWNKQFLDLIEQASTETEMLDFKIGLHDLRNGASCIIQI